MPDRVAIVTGGLSGLGRGMTPGLAASGVRVLAVGHLQENAASMDSTPNVCAMVASGSGAAMPAWRDLCCIPKMKRHSRRCE